MKTFLTLKGPVFNKCCIIELNTKGTSGSNLKLSFMVIWLKMNTIVE